RQPGQRRSRRPSRQGRGASLRSRRDHGHISIDAWRVRGWNPRYLRRRARARRPGIRGRREPECASGPGRAGRVRRRRLAPESAQDILHSARRRRPRRRTGRSPRASRAIPPWTPLLVSGRAECAAGRTGIGSALRQCRDPADFVDVYRNDGRRRSESGDRFVDAMIAIREEISAIEDGRMDRADNPLKNAPHTAATLLAADWAHAYSREKAAYPVSELKADKYWPPVGRADNVYGDRNLFC